MVRGVNQDKRTPARSADKTGRGVRGRDGLYDCEACNVSHRGRGPACHAAGAIDLCVPAHSSRTVFGWWRSSLLGGLPLFEMTLLAMFVLSGTLFLTHDDTGILNESQTAGLQEH